MALITGITVEADASIVVLTSSKMFRIDPITGGTTVVSSSAVGVGPHFVNPEGSAVEANGSLVVVDWSSIFVGQEPNRVTRVDPATGDQTTVSDATSGSGPLLQNPQGIAVAADGSLFVADGHHTGSD